MHSPAIEALRQATRRDHDALEQDADIEARLADTARRPQVLDAFHRFHAALEAAAHPLIAPVAHDDFRPTSRADMIRTGMADLALRPGPVASVRIATLGEALGWVYVAEGSMLGGRIIRRRLQAAGASLDGLDFLDPWGERTGERWRGMIALMDRTIERGHATLDQIAQGGIDGFTHARRTLAQTAPAET